jgi:hypothetical protein
MYGPMPAGHWTRSLSAREDRAFVRGARYRVVQPFRDFDGEIHFIGETWTFLGSSFAPHDDGISWFVSLDGEREWHIRMRDAPEDQGPIVDNIAWHVRRVTRE